VVGVEQVAVFRCQNLNADFVVWRVNETHVTFNSPHPDPDITIDRTMDGNDNVVNLLSMVAQSNYNKTVIVCIANSIGGNSNYTTPVKLLIEGKLTYVTGLPICITYNTRSVAVHFFVPQYRF
jgi:hypothetical protein